MDPDKLKFRNAAILVLIVSLGIFLRLYRIGGESLWLDEGYSINMAHMDVSELTAVTAGDVHPPLYYVLLHYWISIFGDSEAAVRGLSALFGVLSLLVIFKVGQLLFAARGGVISCMLLSFSAFHVRYSQEARNYSLMALLTLLSFYFFIRILRERNFRTSFGYVFSTVLLLYTHNYGLFIVLAENITFLAVSLLSGWRNFKRWVVLQGVLLGLFLPWVYPLMTQISKVEKSYWISAPTEGTLVSSLSEYAGSIYALPLFLVLVLLSILAFRRDAAHGVTYGRPDSDISPSTAFILLSAWFLTPLVLPLLVSLFSQPIFRPKYAISASLAFYLLAAKGIDGVRSKVARALLICLVILLSLASVKVFFGKTYKEQWREAASYIDVNARPGDLILLTQGRPVFDYYFNRTDVSIKKLRVKRGRDAKEARVKALSSGKFRRVWVIMRRGVAHDKIISKFVNEQYEVSYDKKYVGLDVCLFTWKSVDMPRPAG